MHMKFLHKDSSENQFELKPGMCEVDEEHHRKQDTVQEYFRNSGTNILWKTEINYSKEIVSFGYVIFGYKMDMQVKEI